MEPFLIAMILVYIIAKYVQNYYIKNLNYIQVLGYALLDLLIFYLIFRVIDLVANTKFLYDLLPNPSAIAILYVIWVFIATYVYFMLKKILLEEQKVKTYQFFALFELGIIFGVFLLLVFVNQIFVVF